MGAIAYVCCSPGHVDQICIPIKLLGIGYHCKRKQDIEQVIWWTFYHVCPAMEELDGDDIRLSSGDRVAERDIVQVS